MKGRRRTIIVVGATVIEIGVAKLFGLAITESIFMVLLGNILVAQFADMVYKGKIFKK